MDSGHTSCSLIIDSTQYEQKILKEYEQSKPVRLIHAKLDADALMIPAVGVRTGARVVFLDKENEDKALLYAVVVAAYNYLFTDEFASEAAQAKFKTIVRHFVNWLNEAEITNRYKILKEYESYMFDKRNNHGGSSELISFNSLFTYAFRYKEFVDSLSKEQMVFLSDLKKTKISPNVNKAQATLSSWFGHHDWLQDDELGVGPDSYRLFASPKLLTGSIRATVSSILICFHGAKLALREFMSNKGLALKEVIGKANDGDRATPRMFFIELIKHYHLEENKSEELKKALSLVLRVNFSSEHVQIVEKLLRSMKDFEELVNRKDGSGYKKTALIEFFTSSSSGCSLQLDTLVKLADFGEPLPITDIESLAFTMLMASLAVQPTDIKGLTKNSFRLLKKGNKITDIESEYFKSRSNRVQRTHSLPAREIEGQALITYLQQHPTEKLNAMSPSEAFVRLSQTGVSIFGSLVTALSDPYIYKFIVMKHKQKGDLPLNLVEALKAIYRNKNRKTVTYLFSLTSIKNSSVHAYSDPYTLHYLINYNSHTNATEKSSYLSFENEEWINSSGRITREVMLDLINNVFDINFDGLSDEQIENVKVGFNSEFMGVTSQVSQKTDEMLGRLRVVTGQSKGVINEVGVLSLSSSEKEFFAPLYVLDSPVTACKFFNYIYEFKINYKKLLAKNPEYFYKTVLPTVAWMEHAQNMLSKVSTTEGMKLFKSMKDSGVTLSVFHSI
jgi:hypothetical protein